MTPKRIQLSRRKGWRKPPNTVVVSRPSLFGNPHWHGVGCRMNAVHLYELDLLEERWMVALNQPVKRVYARRILENLGKLRGKNLACWCSTASPLKYCHADVLLELANKPAAKRTGRAL